MLNNAAAKGEQKLTNRMEHVGNYIQAIIKDQEKIRAVSLERVKKYKADLKALRFRLKPYVNKKPIPRDEHYASLKDEYEDTLQRVAVLERTVLTCDESITNAKLNQAPGQYTGAQGIQ